MIENYLFTIYVVRSSSAPTKISLKPTFVTKRHLTVG